MWNDRINQRNDGKKYPLITTQLTRNITVNFKNKYDVVD